MRAEPSDGRTVSERRTGRRGGRSHRRFRARLREELRQPSLVLRFGALSLVLVVLLGALIGRELGIVITDRAHVSAQASGELNVQLALRTMLKDSTGNVGPASSGQLSLSDALMKTPVVAKQIVSVRAWTPGGLIVFSSDASTIGILQQMPARAKRALRRDKTDSVVLDVAKAGVGSVAPRRLVGDDRVMVVDMPVSLGNNDRSDLVIELAMPYAPTAAAIRADTNRVYLWLAVGFLVLYLALFRLVASASRRLRRQSKANRVLALHDTLTGLANRSLLRDRVERAVVAARRHNGSVALLLLDLDRFKEINDTLGHHHGDLLLRMIGPRLQSVLRDEDTVARLGGDEFVVLLPEAKDRDSVAAVVTKLLAVLTEVFEVGDVSLDVGCSIGIALTPEHGTDFETLLQHADVAMYAAKAEQLGASFYDPTQDANSLERLALLGELRRGIDGGQLLLHYQPKADLATGNVRSVEALVRWAHPTLGLLPPDQFIPLAEHTGLIRPLTLVVLDQALSQVRQWADGGRPLAVAVNISARCLLDMDFPDKVTAALDRHGVPPEGLQLEITESTVMVDPARALSVLRSLARRGLTLSIDDFGTGYSSLAYLQRLPVHELKIDRSFVSHLRNRSNAAIVRTSIDLGRHLGLRVVAEGVEDAETWNTLAELGCDAAQGYYLSRPVPAAQLETWLRARDAAGPAWRTASAAAQG